LFEAETEMGNKHKIVFQPSGRQGEVDDGVSVLAAAQEFGVDIVNLCGKQTSCGKCKIKLSIGNHAKFGMTVTDECLSPWVADEEKHINEAERADHMRLSCQAKVLSDVVVYVPEESRGVSQIVRKSASKRQISINPAVKKYYVEMEPPTIDEPLGDFERIVRALDKRYQLGKDLTIDYRTLLDIPNVVREAGWKVTVTVWWEKEVQKIEPGDTTDNQLGLAIDVGTTSVAGYLCDLRNGKVRAIASVMNPQTLYGEDIMSRITYHMTTEGGLERMHKAIINEGINRIVENVCADIQCKPEDILEMVLVANTAMHHIILNLNVEPLGLSPFPPVIHRFIDIKPRELGIKMNPGGNVHILPNEAGFVGADNMGVLIAEEPYNQDQNLLLIDIGTNAELVLGTRGKLVSASCPTGPAFEGAQIKFGIRATPGAIEHVKIDPVTFEPEYRVIGVDEWLPYKGDEANAPDYIKPKGICGSAIIDVMAELFRTGLMLKSGYFNMNLDTPRLRMHGDEPEYVLAWAKETSIGKDIVVTVGDVRAIQMAKGALYAACKFLMMRHNIKEVDKVILAGAFGSYIDKKQALIIGMFPDIDLNKVFAIGNAAGDGARIALLNKDKRWEALQIAPTVEYLELSTLDDFIKEFGNAMPFPHIEDEFPHLREFMAERLDAPDMQPICFDAEREDDDE
jgi:uncharacterized 2Fe-2S/4Fe-4S cluster protein (DUF4445 family)